MANRVEYGLSNVHVASVTIAEGGAVTFGTPTAIPGAVNISIEQEGETTTFHADNTAYWVGTSNSGYTGSIELANVPDSFYVDYLGMTMDTNNNVVERATDQANYFALLFEGQGDEKAVRHCFFYCKATRPNTEQATTEDSVEPQTKTLDFAAIALPGSGVIKSKTTPTSTNYNTWYTTVAVPTFESESE